MSVSGLTFPKGGADAVCMGEWLPVGVLSVGPIAVGVLGERWLGTTPSRRVDWGLCFSPITAILLLRGVVAFAWVWAADEPDEESLGVTCTSPSPKQQGKRENGTLRDAPGRRCGRWDVLPACDLWAI